MKNDKLLTELRRIEASLLTGEPDCVALQNLINEVEGEIRDEANKESGKGSVAKAAQNILKEAQKVQRNCEGFHKAYRANRSLNVCDGYRAVRFNLDTAPVLVEHPAGYDYPNIDRIIEGSKGNDVPVNVPSLGELRAFIKTEKARLKTKKDKSGMRFVLIVESGVEVHVNAEYLLDMLMALPGATVTASKRRTVIGPLYFEAENGDGILLPLRKEDGGK